MVSSRDRVRGRAIAKAKGVEVMEGEIKKRQKLQEVQKELLFSFPTMIASYAFGSRIKGTARPDSDLDLAVLVPGYADPIHLWEVSNRLATKLGYEVDLLDLRAASTVMQYQVITTGLRLYGENIDADLFELFIHKEKRYLDRLRADQLKQIAQEGRVYAK